MSADIRFVLVETSHPGNIGAAARAMKNMCLKQLVLVNPARFPSAEATARASGADDLLAVARQFPDLDAAIADCRLVVGASARRRNVDWPELTPRECAELVRQAAADGPVAVVFGREDSGLSNAELARCRYLVRVPCNPAFPSLNLAMAVQVIAYEIMVAAAPGAAAAEAPPAATAAELAGLFGHLEQAIVDIGFADQRQSTRLMQRLKRLFQKAEPDADDINILRGILSAAQGRKSMRRSGN